ncbi:MAG: RNA-binding domain-containing protein [Patescibacteria group bacterium]
MANDTTIIKRSPFILIRTFVAIEFMAFFAYYLSTGHGSYKSEFYNTLFLHNLLSYEIAKILFLSSAQLLITIYAFVRWYTESYSVRPGTLAHQWGVFFKKDKTIPLNKSMTVTVSSNPFGKWFHYGSINIENGSQNSSAVLTGISRPADVMKSIERCINPQNNHFAEPDVPRLLKADEHERLEFKSSLRFDHKNGNVNRELEWATMKTIAAFLNTKGGEIVLGVSDRREPVGLLSDYRTLRRPDSDGFENHFTQVFNMMIGPEFRHLVKLWFNRLGNDELCVIQVAPSARPVYLKIDDNEHFYVRTGNVTTPLKLSEVEVYRRSRWPSRITQSA